MAKKYGIVKEFFRNELVKVLQRIDEKYPNIPAEAKADIIIPYLNDRFMGMNLREKYRDDYEAFERQYLKIQKSERAEKILIA